MNLIEIPTTQVEDLVVTFIHRPVKDEPMIYDDTDLIPAQLDGQTDFLSDNNPVQTKQMNEDKKLDKIIAKIKSNISKPNKAIEINPVPQRSDTSQINDINQQKSSNQLQKDVRKSSKKKIIPPLLTPLLKTNEEVIRPLDERNRFPSKHQTIDNNIHSRKFRNNLY